MMDAAGKEGSHYEVGRSGLESEGERFGDPVGPAAPTDAEEQLTETTGSFIQQTEKSSDTRATCSHLNHTAAILPKPHY